MPWDLRTSRKDEITKDMVIARLNRGGETFEILVRPEAVEALRAGEDVNLVDAVASDLIFRDVKKGLRASEEKMVELFGTSDFLAVATLLVQEGDIALTTEQRRALREAKRKQIVAYIAANAVNPQTGTPHPPQRIENAMEEAGVHVDPFRPMEEQVDPTLEALRPLLPLSVEKTKFAIKLLPADAGKAYGEVRSYGTILQEEWQPDGSWVGVVEVAAGFQGEFLDRLNERTHGNVETKILK